MSRTMWDCVQYMQASDNRIVRHPGGFWAHAGWKSGLSFGTTTVEGLVRRGIAEYTRWREGRNGRFPIEATLVSPTKAEELCLRK